MVNNVNYSITALCSFVLTYWGVGGKQLLYLLHQLSKQQTLLKLCIIIIFVTLTRQQDSGVQDISLQKLRQTLRCMGFEPNKTLKSTTIYGRG